jgi:solute carrier family 25, member 38
MSKEKKLSTHIYAGGFSGGVAAILTQPFDVVKTNMIGNFSSAKTHQTGILEQIKQLKKTNGILGFWNGTIPSLFRVVPGAALYYGMIHFSTEQIKKKKKKPNSFENFTIGFVSRAMAAYILSPFTLIKTRFEFYPSDIGLAQTIKSIWKVEGVKGLFNLHFDIGKDCGEG